MLHRLLVLFMIAWLPVQAVAASLPVCVHLLAPAGEAGTDETPPCHTDRASKSSWVDSLADAVCDDCESCHAIGATALPVDRRTSNCDRISLYDSVAPAATPAVHRPPPTPPPSI